MSTKIAVIIGDYSNGWSDSWVIQEPTKIANIKQLEADRDAVREIMGAALGVVIKAVEGNENINPRPADEPCCAKWEEVVKECSDLLNADKFKRCPECGVIITKERREKAGRGF